MRQIMNRSDDILVFKDSTNNYHCRMCIGTDCSEYFHDADFTCYSLDDGTKLEEGFIFDNTKDEIILSANINKINRDPILVERCIKKIQELMPQSEQLLRARKLVKL